jgi:acyl carrier protein
MSSSPQELASSRELSDAETRALHEALKRCSPATLAAACAYRRTGNPEHLATVVTGVVERFVERELRPKVTSGDENLRLVEDLGIDSLTMMEIVLLAEDVLSISVSNEELIKLRTLGEVRRFVMTKAQAPAA